MLEQSRRDDQHRRADGALEQWSPLRAKWEVVQSAPAAVQTARAAARPSTPAGTIPFKSAPGERRTYAAARNTRSTGGFGTGWNTSADAELKLSLPQLRARSRQMVRDASFALRAKTLVVNNVIGSGVGMQAQVMNTRGDLNKRVNADIEAAWCEWATAENCHTGGAMHFHDLERMAMGQVFDAGEIFIRKHYSKFGGSKVPLGLEVIEPERLAFDIGQPGAVDTGNEIRMGIEVDAVFGRAVAYWLRRRHPGDIIGSIQGTDRFERVPAADMIHLRVVNRWPQTRGEPWLHTVLRKIDELNEYTGSEVSAARASSYYFATIETPEDDGGGLPTDKDENTGQLNTDIEPLTIQELKPGEKLDFHTPNRPNTGMADFVRSMLREVAAGTGTSYESLSRDYSQGNYSSSRMGLLDDRDLYKTIQRWWIRNFRQPLHAVWLQQAVLAKALDSISPSAYAGSMTQYESVLFKPRGWSWVDPTKEVDAYKEAIKGGLTTLTDVIAATAGGQDIEDFITVRKRELEMLEAAGITVDTTVIEAIVAPPVTVTSTTAAVQEEDGASGDGAPADGDDAASTSAGRAHRVVFPLRGAA